MARTRVPSFGHTSADRTYRLEDRNDFVELTGDGEFSDLEGFTDDLDLDFTARPPWKLES